MCVFYIIPNYCDFKTKVDKVACKKVAGKVQERKEIAAICQMNICTTCGMGKIVGSDWVGLCVSDDSHHFEAVS